MKILYAEDTPQARYLLEVLLKADGHDIVTAADGETALQLLHTQPFDLIISDILMPEMDGFMLCHQIKTDPTLAHIPFIFYSAIYTQPDDIAFAKSIGAEEFLIKPLPPEDFLQELGRIIARYPQCAKPLPALDEIQFLRGYAQRIGLKLESTYSKLDSTSEQLDSTRDELQQTRRILNVLADHHHDALLVTDMNGRLLTANSKLKALTKLSENHSILSLSDLLPPQRCASLLKMLQENLQLHHSLDFQETLISCGEQVLITASIVHYATQPALMLIVHSIENYVQAHAPSALHEHVLKNLIEGVIITDADNNIISINPAFSRITGYTADEVVGKNPRLLQSGRQDLAFHQKMWTTLLTEGSWQGEVWNRRKDGKIYPEWMYLSIIRNELGGVAFHVAIFSDISEHEEARLHIEHLAHHDPLTNLPNRTLLSYHLKDALLNAARHKRKLALITMGLDRFKIINDTLGRQAGDELIKTVTERLKHCIRQLDTVGRLGGDEFLLVLADIESEGDAMIVANKILAAIRKPFLIADKELSVTPSLGIAFYPEHGTDDATLIQHAEDALYYAKDEGRNQFQTYNSKLHHSAELRLTLDNALAHALERGELRLVYQPQVRMSDNAIVGCEVLLRWQSSELGNIPPIEFIPIAEDTGRINVIGDWVLRTACHQAAEWQRAGLPKILVAVNLSAIQFKQPNLTDKVKCILEESGLDPQYLELELTESILMRDANDTLEMLQKFKAMQLQLSIDDFGTGYSNLAYLNRFSANKLKIDQSFVRGLPRCTNDAAIVNAIIQMAYGLGLEVIAEGIETVGQRDFLIAHGCLLAQGYLYSKPLETDVFEKLLRQGL